MTYALDTNTVSYFLRGEGNVDECFSREVIQSGNRDDTPKDVEITNNQFVKVVL